MTNRNPPSQCKVRWAGGCRQRGEGWAARSILRTGSTRPALSSQRPAVECRSRVALRSLSLLLSCVQSPVQRRDVNAQPISGFVYAVTAFSQRGLYLLVAYRRRWPCWYRHSTPAHLQADLVQQPFCQRCTNLTFKQFSQSIKPIPHQRIIRHPKKSALRFGARREGKPLLLL